MRLSGVVRLGQETLDHGDEVGEAQGLGEIGAAAGRAHAGLVAGHGVRGHGEHRDVPGTRGALQLTRRLHAVQSGQANVHDHEVRTQRGRPGDHLGPVG